MLKSKHRFAQRLQKKKSLRLQTLPPLFILCSVLHQSSGKQVTTASTKVHLLFDTSDQVLMRIRRFQPHHGSFFAYWWTSNWVRELHNSSKTHTSDVDFKVPWIKCTKNTEAFATKMHLFFLSKRTFPFYLRRWAESNRNSGVIGCQSASPASVAFGHLPDWGLNIVLL